MMSVWLLTKSCIYSKTFHHQHAVIQMKILQGVGSDRSTSKYVGGLKNSLCYVYNSQEVL